MSRFIKKYGLYLLLGCFSLMLNGCIKENLDDCKPYCIHFVYDYNLEYNDLFSKEVTKMNLYVFDENGNFVKEFQEIIPSTSSGTYSMEIPLPNGQYTFIAWAGVSPDAYAVAGGDALKNTKLDDFKLQLAQLAAGETNQKLPDLYFGRLTSTVEINKEGTISLVKNSKTVTVTMLPINDSGTPIVLNKDNYKIWIETPDGIYDSNNNPSGGIIKHGPYTGQNNNDGGFTLEISTLRLMANAVNTLVIETSYGEPLLRLNLNNLIDELRMSGHGNLSLQEYLDRQSKFDIVIDGVIDNEMFSSISITVNGWLIRNQNVHN